MTDTEILIEADGISKYYSDFTAVEEVSFQIRRGEVVAFLGPNGAGKSTTMKILTGYLAPTRGHARIAGFDMATQRLEGAKHLGYLPENGPLYADMTPRGLLTFFAEAREVPPSQRKRRMEQVIELCDLGSVLEKPIGKLSRGYRQRVGMAQVLLHEPEVLILDEPTTGLDPNQIHEVRKTIRRLSENRTILLSTHILQEVEAMASRILFISEGRLVYDGSVEQLLENGETLDSQFRRLTTVS
ncbi:MAG: ABC transporter ATP-binding protein [Planctomycetia bacterium]|nr:ABC transporter ATP-binding protein [Planctomycetia bacterium]